MNDPQVILLWCVRVCVCFFFSFPLLFFHMKKEKIKVQLGKIKIITIIKTNKNTHKSQILKWTPVCRHPFQKMGGQGWWGPGGACGRSCSRILFLVRWTVASLTSQRAPSERREEMKFTGGDDTTARSSSYTQEGCGEEEEEKLGRAGSMVWLGFSSLFLFVFFVFLLKHVVSHFLFLNFLAMVFWHGDDPC